MLDSISHEYEHKIHFMSQNTVIMNIINRIRAISKGKNKDLILLLVICQLVCVCMFGLNIIWLDITVTGDSFKINTFCDALL